MAKPRKLKKTNNILTELLSIPELKATGGDEHDISAMSPDTALPVCAECGGPVENHGKFKRTLIDVIKKDEKKQFARLHYYFYKYRCLDPECGAVFQKPVGFVNENSKTTKRYEDEVMRHVMYESMDKARVDMEEFIVPGYEDDLISKPAISKLIKRWVKDKDESRRFQTPSCVLIYSFESYHRPYSVICEFENNDLSVVEVTSSISAAAIKEYFSKVEIQYIYSVIVDYNPVVYEAVRELFPESKIHVNTDALMYLLEQEYDDCVFERAKNYSKEIRRNLRSSGFGLSNEDAAKVYRIRRNDDILRGAYKSYSKLYMLLKEHRDIFEVQEWMDNLGEDDKKTFALTILYLKSYWKEIVNYYKRRTKVFDGQYEKLYKLNLILESYFSQCTDDVFRARLLYSQFDKPDGPVWKGIPVDDLLDILGAMISEGGLEEHERKRR